MKYSLILLMVASFLTACTVRETKVIEKAPPPVIIEKTPRPIIIEKNPPAIPDHTIRRR